VRAWVALILAPLLVPSGACTPKQKESKVARDIKIVREENKPDRLFEKAKAFHQVGDLTRAEQYYAAALDQGYPEAKVLPLLIRVCIDSSRFQVAIEYAEPILKKNPRDHRLRTLIAALYSAIGYHTRARSYYEIALDDEPNDATTHYALAVLLRDEFKDVLSADKHFREYLRVAPEGPHAQEAKGSLLKEVPPPSTEKAVTTVPSSKPAPTAAPSTNSSTAKPIKLP
jgi:tetratricopeptide (TPR) repeat protein